MDLSVAVFRSISELSALTSGERVRDSSGALAVGLSVGVGDDARTALPLEGVLGGSVGVAGSTGGEVIREDLVVDRASDEGLAVLIGEHGLDGTFAGLASTAVSGSEGGGDEHANNGDNQNS